jgi:hypothetical protein
MPLVFSEHHRRTHYVPDEEALAEILGHSNFDGREWAIGDLIVFEDGTEAAIEQARGEHFHTWAAPRPAELAQVVARVRAYHPVVPSTTDRIESWENLFNLFKAGHERRGKSGCAGVIASLAFAKGLLGFAAP